MTRRFAHSPLPKILVAAVMAALLMMPVMGQASDLDVAAVVDAESNPVSGVELYPGAAVDVKVTYVVTGRQANPASFHVYGTFTVTSDGVVGSNPIKLEAPAREAQDSATKYPVTTKFVAPTDATPGARTVTIGGFGVETSSPAALALGDSATVTVTVLGADEPSDTESPELILPEDMTVEANGPDGAIVDFECSAVDAVDGVVPVTCAPATGSVFPLGTTMVACEASDESGNKTTGSFMVTVVDTTAPSITVPVDIAAWATSSAGAVVDFECSATDLVDPSPSVVCVPASGSVFPLGATTVTCTATDASGNSASETFVVRVAYEWAGILQPINADGSSIFKAGSTVPVKFCLGGAGAGIGDATAKIYLSKMSSDVWGDETEAASSTPASSGNLFRYNAEGDLYIFNYGTKGLTQGSYRIRIDLGDGEARYAHFSLKK